MPYPEDMAMVNLLQGRIKVEAVSPNSFTAPNYENDGFAKISKTTFELARHFPNSRHTFGRNGKVDSVRHFLRTAFRWRGLPEKQNYYLGTEPSLPVGHCKVEVLADVPVETFWSISLYNASNFFEANALNVHNIDSVSGEPNSDGSMTL
jgi:hypothetical protein